MVISFKLETDVNILKQKVFDSIKKYNLDYVIGNILGIIKINYKIIVYLDTRRTEVLLFKGNMKDEIKITNDGVKWLEI